MCKKHHSLRPLWVLFGNVVCDHCLSRSRTSSRKPIDFQFCIFVTCYILGQMCNNINICELCAASEGSGGKSLRDPEDAPDDMRNLATKVPQVVSPPVPCLLCLFLLHQSSMFYFSDGGSSSCPFYAAACFCSFVYIILAPLSYCSSSSSSSSSSSTSWSSAG